MVVTDLFAEMFFRQKLFTNDIAATGDNILCNNFLYRAGNPTVLAIVFGCLHFNK
jgi:hypothetical protein